jgi:hypothetical protein
LYPHNLLTLENVQCGYGTNHGIIREKNINDFLHMMDINAKWDGIYRPLGQETKYGNDISSCIHMIICLTFEMQL